MGAGRWDDSKWDQYAAVNSYSKKSTHEIYSSRALKKDLDPKGVKIRESRDSKENPNSTPIIVALDVTGSMGPVLDSMARKGLKTLMSQIYERRPVSDPHLMVMGIGDIECDRAPLQVTQFEADIRIAEQLDKLFLEQGGGGNSYESYALAWYFAANHTSIDSFEKRKKKGYLFTVGDEGPTPHLDPSRLVELFGSKEEVPKRMIEAESLLTKVSRQWEVFHLIVEEGDYARSHPDTLSASWNRLLGQHVLHLADHTKLAEVVVSTLQVSEGGDHKKIAASWDKSTGMVVKRAIESLVADRRTSPGLARL